jgi:hypothetical protein
VAGPAVAGRRGVADARLAARLGQYDSDFPALGDHAVGVSANGFAVGVLQRQPARADPEVVGFLDEADEAGVRKGIDGERGMAKAEAEDRDGAPGDELQDGRHWFVLR